MVQPGSVVILDCGGQYAHLIGSRIRRLGAYSEIAVAETSAEELRGAAGIILSGGPQSVYEKGSPQADPKIFELGIPILGLCYGHQWIAHALGGAVSPGTVKEYGHAMIEHGDGCAVLDGLPERFSVWMSHGDEVTSVPAGFRVVARSRDCAVAAMCDEARKIYSLQFHVEVTHTQYGMDILERFIEICEPAAWSIESYATHVGEQIRAEVQGRKVFMLVSGGVDSTVAFTLLDRVLGPERVYGLLVDTGLMRKGEVAQIQEALQDLGYKNLHVEDASEKFFVALEGVTEPEEKRKIIGRMFLEVQRDVCHRLGISIEAARCTLHAANWLLGQGTIYPDTIETGGTKHADHIKTHHNRVPEIREMMEKGLVIEPLKDLYKDEVRRLGEELGLPHDLVWRHPFPGPGLGVRILCSGDPKRGQTLSTPPAPPKGSDPFSSVVLPIQSVGVQGDGRTYRHAVVLFTGSAKRGQTLSALPAVPKESWFDRAHHDTISKLATDIPNRHRDFNRVLFCISHEQPFDFRLTPGSLTRKRANLLRDADAIVTEELHRSGLYEAIWQFPVVLLPCGSKPGMQSIVLRPITSEDAMTASAYMLPEDVLSTITARILKECPGIDTVLLDLTSKPPATIEWE